MSEAQDLNPRAALEALLFIHGEPLSFKQISTRLNLEIEAVKSLVQEMQEHLRSPERGLALIADGERVQLVTKSQFASLLSNFVKEELTKDLTPASVETLALIAYFGPISRSTLDYHRGVNSALMLRSLMLRGLVERFSDPENSHSHLYRPTFDLLRYLGVERQEDLPDFNAFRELMEKFKTDAEQKKA